MARCFYVGFRPGLRLGLVGFVLLGGCLLEIEFVKRRADVGVGVISGFWVYYT